MFLYHVKPNISRITPIIRFTPSGNKLQAISSVINYKLFHLDSFIGFHYNE
jgi:hypothetical protein